MTTASTATTMSTMNNDMSAAPVSPAASAALVGAGDADGLVPSRPGPARRLVALACAVALSAGLLGACTVNLDHTSSGSSGSAGASSHSAVDPSQEPSGDSDGDMPTSSASPTALPPLTDQGGTASPIPGARGRRPLLPTRSGFAPSSPGARRR